MAYVLSNQPFQEKSIFFGWEWRTGARLSLWAAPAHAKGPLCMSWGRKQPLAAYKGRKKAVSNSNKKMMKKEWRNGMLRLKVMVIYSAAQLDLPFYLSADPRPRRPLASELASPPLQSQWRNNTCRDTAFSVTPDVGRAKLESDSRSCCERENQDIKVFEIKLVLQFWYLQARRWSGLNGELFRLRGIFRVFCALGVTCRPPSRLNSGSQITLHPSAAFEGSKQTWGHKNAVPFLFPVGLGRKTLRRPIPLCGRNQSKIFNWHRFMGNRDKIKTAPKKRMYLKWME